jgi:protein-S-isoprenylcysteine O-methyltransferase Ste14
VIARVPLTPRLILRQKQSRPAPNGETTPIPLMTTRGTPLDRIALTIIPAVQSTGAVPQRLARSIALGGLIFFLDALIYFAYRYEVVFARQQAGAVSTRAIAVNVTLFTVFALHHSLFARDAIRKHITRIVGALERSTYVWLASALFIAVCAWWQPIAGLAWRTDRALFVWLLHVAQLLGLLLTLRSALMIDFFELGGVRQVSVGRALPGAGDATRARPTEFKSAGPYGWIRHPIYLGWFLMLFAVPVMTTTRFVFAVTSSAYLLIAIPLEERSLRRSSGGAYDEYMREVRWKLLPRVF